MRTLFFFQGSQLTECVDKHSYRSSYPLVHSVNQCTRNSTNLDLVVGFNGGPIQHLNPISQAAKGVYNGDVRELTCYAYVLMRALFWHLKCTSSTGCFGSLACDFFDLMSSVTLKR